ncbi:hypothetical protein GXW82_24800 [Streptacidiphilus sp. 4-A2]|nr:hypothetical protein [Streptacidiphilus sp. 4-A2]
MSVRSRYTFSFSALAVLCGSFLLPSGPAQAASAAAYNGISVSGKASTERVVIGSAVELTGQVTADGNGLPLPVTVFAHTEGGPAGYRKVAQVFSDSDADYRLTVRPRANTSYIVQVLGYGGRIESAPVEVAVDHRVTLQAPPQAPGNRRAVFSGKVTGGGHEQVMLQMLDGDHWRDIASTRTDADGHYAVEVPLERRGDAHWRVTTPATPGSAPGSPRRWSSARPDRPAGGRGPAGRARAPPPTGETARAPGPAYGSGAADGRRARPRSSAVPTGRCPPAPRGSLLTGR